MELFLNIVWFVLSAALVWGYVAFARSVLRSRRWTLVVALMLLILVLLPAISMTDDLATITNPAVMDHTLRRHGVPLDLHTDIAVAAIVALMLSIFALSVARAPGERVAIHARAAALRDGMLRAFGVRPPPYFASNLLQA